MLPDVSRDHPRVSIEAATRREANDEPNGLSLVEWLLREGDSNVHPQTRGEAHCQQRHAPNFSEHGCLSG
jgi:hypothetical protein